MPSTRIYRDAALAVLAVALLTAPLWTPTFNLGETTYRYESVTVETDGTTMRFANDPAKHGVGISQGIACAEGGRSRSCAFERYFVANYTVPTTVYSGNPDYFHTDAEFERYDYVYLHSTVYEAVCPANESVTYQGAVRLELGLRPVPAEEALDWVSIPAVHPDSRPYRTRQPTLPSDTDYARETR